MHDILPELSKLPGIRFRQIKLKGSGKLAFDFPDAYRTSNMINRHMEPMSRWLASSRFFHGHRSSAELQIRFWAILHNFWPYCPRARVTQEATSPVHKLMVSSTMITGFITS